MFSSDGLTEGLGPRGQRRGRQESRGHWLDGSVPIGTCCVAHIVFYK